VEIGCFWGVRFEKETEMQMMVEVIGLGIGIPRTKIQVGALNKVKPLLKRIYFNLSILAGFFCIHCYVFVVW
jgi:hypothetical protein